MIGFIMFKRIASFCLILFTLLVHSNPVDARAKKTKKSQTASSAKKSKLKKKSPKYSKASKHKRKSRRFSRGTGPDLKTITTDSPYTEDSTNGINPIENKQPGI